MKKSATVTALLLGWVFAACNQSNSSDTQQADTTNQVKPMKNPVSIVEIPVSDLSRAMVFYKAILAIDIEEVDMGGVKMGVLPSDGRTVSVILAKGNDYKPSVEGALVYLNAGDDLQVVLNKIEPNGGKVIVPKTEISPEMGFFAIFIDTEGNKIGLHSSY